MSGAPIISGTNQLPNPPIIAGMTMKKTMIRPWAVISTFQKWLAFVERRRRRARIAAQACRCCMPGSASSQRIRPEMAPPMTPAVIAKIK